MVFENKLMKIWTLERGRFVYVCVCVLSVCALFSDAVRCWDYNTASVSKEA